MRSLIVSGTVCALFCFATLARGAEKAAAAAESVRLVKGLTAADQEYLVPANALYPSNRAPLAPSPLVKLPVGSITPRGWLRRQLELERDGMTGHLAEISPWCKFEGSAWASPQGQGHSPWEEFPYWFKGYGDLGYVLKDDATIRQARRWIEGMLASQEADGWFGPRALKKGEGGEFGNNPTGADLWPYMPVCNALQSYYEFSGDPRILRCLTRFFRWELDHAGPRFLGNWADVRKGDNLESVYWLYNRTGEPWLLELATKIHRGGVNWTRGLFGEHGVNFSQGFREPAEYSMQSGDPKEFAATVRNYRTVMDVYGQFPGGGFAADENFRRGCVDPRQGFETCSWVEFMHSFEMLTKISGDPQWADRCEEIAFNSFPASMSPELKGLHYLTAPNQPQLDQVDKSPGIQNGGPMFIYSPWEFRCCQHNVSHGWPYYAEELWLATWDRGLCASLYAASEVTAKVGDGTAITVAETTDYPFDGTVQLKLSSPKTVRFPLYLRVPGWCEKPALSINGKDVPVATATQNTGCPAGYLRIERTWKDGDAVVVRLPMTLGVQTWAKNHNGVSVNYGPLTFSLKIGERWLRWNGTDKWPGWEVLPTTPWNYGLVLDEKDPARSFELVRSLGPVAAQPFTAETAPLQLKVKARRIPNWALDGKGLVGMLQASPARSEEPIETITMVPMGAARLRISVFPTIASGSEAHAWELPPDVWVSTSYNGDEHAVQRLREGGHAPASSNDPNIPRFTWWNHSGTKEWLQYDFQPARTVSEAAVYWFDDTGRGGCRVPASWRLLYKDGASWKPVEGASAYGTQRDRLNRTTFRAVETKSLRIEVQLQPGFSGGVFQVNFGAAWPPTADIFVSLQGNDAWSGRLAEPNRTQTDGPVATIEHAQQLVRNLKKVAGRTAPIIVALRGGTCFLKKPLHFGPEDSGTAQVPVVYEAYDHERPILSGGEILGTWEIDDHGRWHKVLDDVKAGKWSFTQLFVNDQRRFRPRMPKQGYYKIAQEYPPVVKAKRQWHDRFGYSGDDVRADWANRGDLEVQVFRGWTAMRMHVAALDPARHVVTLAGATEGPDDFGSFPKGERFLVENVREALGEPGQWYLDRKSGELTYIPLPGEHPDTSDIIAPRLDRLLVLEGDPNARRWVEHVQFRGLTFAHANWTMPPLGQTYGQSEANLDGAVSAVGARNVVFDGCAVRHVGAYAMAFGAGCRDNRIENCELVDMGAGGIQIGHAAGAPLYGWVTENDPEKVVSGHTVRQCLIAHGGRMHAAAAGVLIVHAHDNVVEHNDIFDFYETGVSVGWTWGYGPSQTHHNDIGFNRIHAIGQNVLSDLGAVYTLGVSPGTRVHDNVCHDIKGHDGAGYGLYTDEGSSGIVMENNLVYRAHSGGFHQHYGKENRIANNIFAFGDEAQWQRTRPEPHTSFFIERNIVDWNNANLVLGNNWWDNHYKLDYNVYWNQGKPIRFFADFNFPQWQQKFGQDQHSIAADPLFVAPEKDDFRLRENSPALKLGFRPFDYSKAGRTTPPVLTRDLPPVPRAFE